MDRHARTGREQVWSGAIVLRKHLTGANLSQRHFKKTALFLLLTVQDDAWLVLIVGNAPICSESACKGVYRLKSDFDRGDIGNRANGPVWALNWSWELDGHKSLVFTHNNLIYRRLASKLRRVQVCFVMEQCRT